MAGFFIEFSSKIPATYKGDVNGFFKNLAFIKQTKF